MVRTLAVLVVVVVHSAGWTGPQAAEASGPATVVRYRPPVEAEVVDPFRPPTHPYGPGNRGVDYVVAPGSPVRVAAPGTVTFAGPVAGRLHVVVLHADGIRTSYSFLAAVAVHRGQELADGAVVGTTGERLHLGARLGDAYVDPASLFGDVLPPGWRRRVRLVPDHPPRPASEAGERAGLLALLGRATTTGMAVGRALGTGLPTARAVGAGAVDATAEVRARAAAVARDHPSLALWLAYADALSPEAWAEVGQAVGAAVVPPGECTPADRPPPSAPSGRRVAVLVGGLGSSSAAAGIEAVDTDALGYRPADVHRFSYRGRTVRERPYTAIDTGGDIGRAGDRLRALLGEMARDRPGVPIDLIAHSQGGLVARAALARSVPDEVRTLVTLGTPHQGADIAALARVGAGPDRPRAGVEGALLLAGAGLPTDAPALRQLAPGSRFLVELGRRPPPPHVRVVSVAARGDVVVTSPRARLPGARQVVVSVSGIHQHGRLPGAPAATREIALAVAGAPPTCRSTGDRLADAVAGQVIAVHQRAAVAALGLARAHHPPPPVGLRPSRARRLH